MKEQELKVEREHRITFTPVKITALVMAGLIALLGGGSAWLLIRMFERVVSKAAEADIAATFSAGEVALVALLAATLGVAITGLVTLAVQVLTDPPPPAYPAALMNMLIEKIMDKIKPTE